MATIAELLDLAKTRRGIPTDSALGVRVGKSRQTVSQWRSGVRIPEDDQVLTLARMADTDAGPWLLIVQAARSTGDVAAEWKRLAQRVGIAAAIAIIVTALPQENALISGISVAASLPMHIMFSATAAITAAAAWWVLRSENRSA